MSTKITSLESSIYQGIVYHKRSLPKVHKFDYRIFLYWLKLSELVELEQDIKGFACDAEKFSVVNFKRQDYLGDPSISLQNAVIARMNELNESDKDSLSGDVFLLGQVRTFGLYFSPVNFYYLRNKEGFFSHMLAEVSNTPWNKRHHYLIDLEVQNDCQKAFHVSPFNPMDMQYKWQIAQPGEDLKLHLSCYKQTKHFEAAINMQRLPLNSVNLRSALLSIPSMTLKTVFGIYWQALKLFFKRVPVYTHS